MIESEMTQMPPHDIVQCGVTKHGVPLYATVLSKHVITDEIQEQTVSVDQNLHRESSWKTCHKCCLNVPVKIEKRTKIFALLNIRKNGRKVKCSRCNTLIGFRKK